MRSAPLTLARALVGTVVTSSLLSLPTFGQAPQPRGSWLWVTTAEQGWDSNVLYVADSAAARDFIRRINSTVQITKVRSRGSLTFVGTGAVLFYDTAKVLNTLSFNLQASGTYKLGARTNLLAATSFGRQLVGEVSGTVSNPLLSRALQTTLTFTGGLEHRLTPFVTGIIGTSYSRVRFDRIGFIQGNVVTGAGSLKKRFRSRGAVALLADVSQGAALGVALQTQTLAAAWQPQFQFVRSMLFDFRGGFTRSATGSAAAVYAPTGSVTLADTVGKGLLTIGATRSVAQGFGFGILLVTTAEAASYTFQARRGNFVTLSATNQESQATGSQLGPTGRLLSRGFSGNVRRVFRNGVTIGGGTSYRFRDDVVRATGYSVQLQAGFALGSR